MFDHTSYVPIVRRRGAELAAITNLLAEDFRQITPVIELCEQILPDEKRTALLGVNNSEYFWNVIRSIASAVGDRPYFIDFASVEGLFANQKGLHPLESYFDLLEYHGLRAIPVTGFSRDDNFQKAVERVTSKLDFGLCLRILQSELRDPSFFVKLNLFLRRFDLEPEQVDLLIDLKQTTDAAPSLQEVCARVPNLSQWRTFTVASGAFPRFLSDLEKNAEHELSRADWLHYRDGVTSREGLDRLPTFGDYTIQFPQTPTPLNFLPNVSASIRYASPDHWVIMRGEGLRNENGAKFEQYWGQANSLMFRDEYSGEDFSYGDQYVAVIGSQTSRTGSPATWLRAGINRHLTLTARQISQLFSSVAERAETFGRMRRAPLPTIWNRSRLRLPEHHGQRSLFPYG